MIFVSKEIVWGLISKLCEKIKKENKVKMKEFFDNYEVAWID